MNNAARVNRVVRREPGAPPARGELVIAPEFAKELLTLLDADAAVDALSDSDLLVACCRTLNLDLACIQSEGSSEDGSDFTGNLTDVGRVAAEGLFVFWVVNGSFQTAVQSQGLMPLLEDIAAAPEAVGKQLQQISARVTEIMVQGINAGAHGVIIADDIAYRRSTYMAPGFVEEFLLPVWKAQLASTRELGVPAFFHSDGNLNAVLPLISAAGFNGLQGIEPAAGMDMQKISRAYGQALCPMGNIDPALLAKPGPREDLREQRERLQRAVLALQTSMANENGFIFGTCSGLHAGMSPELVHYMYQLASEADPG